MSRTWDLWAQRNLGTHWHIGDKRWVEIHGLSHPIVAVHVREHDGDPKDPEVTHYGWEPADKPDKIIMIWPRTHGAEHLPPWMSLHMCFPYGIQAAIDHGAGKMIALCITEITDPRTESSR